MADQENCVELLCKPVFLEQACELVLNLEDLLCYLLCSFISSSLILAK